MSGDRDRLDTALRDRTRDVREAEVDRLRTEAADELTPQERRSIGRLVRDVVSWIVRLLS